MNQDFLTNLTQPYLILEAVENGTVKRIRHLNIFSALSFYRKAEATIYFFLGQLTVVKHVNICIIILNTTTEHHHN